MSDDQEQREEKPFLQPVMLMLDKPLACICGKLAIFVTGRNAQPDKPNSEIKTDSWCQECFMEAQKSARAQKESSEA